MNVAANCNFFEFVDLDVDKGLCLVKQFGCFIDYHNCELLMQVLPVTLPVHHFLDPFGRHILDRLELWSIIGSLYSNVVFTERNLLLLNKHSSR